MPLSVCQILKMLKDYKYLEKLIYQLLCPIFMDSIKAMNKSLE
jgi:hypothetical protein